MNKRIVLKLGLVLFALVVSFGMMSCSENPIMGNPSQDLEAGISQGIPTDQITWISWDREILDQITPKGALAKHGEIGFDGKWVTAYDDAEVGGEVTFGNKVSIPEGAVTEDTYVTVQVLFTEESSSQRAVVEFLPSIGFLVPVKVTLRYKYLKGQGFSENDVDFHIYRSEDGGNTWFLIPDEEIQIGDWKAKFFTDHFTRFAYGF